MSSTKEQRATSEYWTWSTMRQRCSNPNSEHYDRYGGRGIKVCKEWDDFNIFIKDLGLKPSSLHSIDRINNNKGYEASNCRWATKKEQSNNTSSNVYFNYKGAKISAYHISKLSNLNIQTVTTRLNRGWSITRIINTPVKHKRRPIFITLNNLTLNIKQWADKLGMDRKTIKNRLKKGLPTSEILHPGKI